MKEKLVIVAINHHGDIEVIRPNNNWKAWDVFESLYAEGYVYLTLTYIEDLEL